MIDKQTAAKNLAFGRIAIGAITWLAPGPAGRAVGVNAARNPQLPYIARLFGVRDIVLGLGALAGDDSQRQTWIKAGAACDAADIAAAAIAGRRGELPAVFALTGVAVATAAAATSIWALR